MMNALGTVTAIFRATACLDTQQGTDLDFIGIKMRTVYLLGAKQKIVKRQFEQGFDFCFVPVEA